MPPTPWMLLYVLWLCALSQPRAPCHCRYIGVLRRHSPFVPSFLRPSGEHDHRTLSCYTERRLRRLRGRIALLGMKTEGCVRSTKEILQAHQFPLLTLSCLGKRGKKSAPLSSPSKTPSIVFSPLSLLHDDPKPTLLITPRRRLYVCCLSPLSLLSPLRAATIFLVYFNKSLLPLPAPERTNERPLWSPGHCPRETTTPPATTTAAATLTTHTLRDSGATFRLSSSSL